MIDFFFFYYSKMNLLLIFQFLFNGPYILNKGRSMISCKIVGSFCVEHLQVQLFLGVWLTRQEATNLIWNEQTTQLLPLKESQPATWENAGSFAILWAHVKNICLAHYNFLYFYKQFYFHFNRLLLILYINIMRETLGSCTMVFFYTRKVLIFLIDQVWFFLHLGKKRKKFQVLWL